MFRRISYLLRWIDWGPGKLPAFFSLILYIGISAECLSASFALYSVFLIVVAAIHCAFGYLVNEWADRDIDYIQGKKNVFRHTKTLKGRLILIGLLGVAFTVVIPFIHKDMVIPLWMCWVFFATAYSLKPLRLKERGFLGLVASTLAQWTLPVLLIFACFDRFYGFDMIAFSVVLTISGGTLEIGHQRHDRNRDYSTGTKTMGVVMELRSMDTLYRIMLVFDKIAVGVLILACSLGLRHGFAWGGKIGPLWPLLLLYLIIFVCALSETARKRPEAGFIDPYYFAGHNANKILHETVPNFILPVYLLGLSIAVQSVIAWLLVIFVLWRIVLGGMDWKWPNQIVHSIIHKTKKGPGRPD